QHALLRLWEENINHPIAGLELAVRDIMFVFGGTFVGLDESVANLTGDSEQLVTVEALTRAGAQADWAGCLTGIARVPPLDEVNLMRVMHWLDFRRAGAGPALDSLG